MDTGWINDEKPLELAVKHEAKHNFQTPIDEIDATARVFDPIIGPLNSRVSLSVWTSKYLRVRKKNAFRLIANTNKI